MLNTTREKKRVAGAKDYMDALQDKYSKICTVRVDFGYKKPYSDNKELKEANKDMNRLMNNRRSKPTIFKDQVGQIIKKEYTEEKGVHFHALFIYDGNKVQKDAFKAQQICDYWKETTKDQGSAYNCNMNKDKYKKLGIGMINHTDKEKRKILDENVISYLCKDDKAQDIEPIKNGTKDRAFVRGTIPKKKNKVGRPRKNT